MEAEDLKYFGDDITFCTAECEVDCMRKPSHIRLKDRPHSFADFSKNCMAYEPQTDYGDYERAVEQMQHDMRYEPTYNAEDGSM